MSPAAARLSADFPSNNVFLDMFFNPRRPESTQTVIDFKRGKAKKHVHPSSATVFLASASPITQGGDDGPVAQTEISLFAYLHSFTQSVTAAICSVSFYRPSAII